MNCNLTNEIIGSYMKNHSFAVAAVLSLPLAFCVSMANAKTTPTPIELCYESIKEQPRTAIQSCLNNTLESSENSLKDAYKKNKAELESIDSVSTKKALKSLSSSKESFAKFRDEECQRRSDAMMGGTGAGDEFISCKAELNIWQASNL